jgi:hypothetical protein
MTTNIKTVDFPPAYLDSFGRQRVSSPTALFSSKLLAGKNPLIWDEQITGVGAASTYNAGQASVSLSVSPGQVGTCVRQSFRRVPYQPGKSQLIFMTGVLGSPVSGSRKRIGQFDSSNGMFFQMSGSGLAAGTISTSGVTTPLIVPQANWNLDTMDGSGYPSNPSGITLDPTRTQIFLNEYEWLGVGTQLFGVVIDRTIYYVHQINNANVQNVAYSSYPNLPIRYEITSDGTNASSDSLVQICSDVSSEGGRSIIGQERSISREGTLLTTANNTSIYGLLSIELKPGQEFATVVPRQFSTVCTTTATYRWILLMNPVIAGALPAAVDIPNSPVRARTAYVTANTLTGGVEVATGYLIASTSGGSVDLPIMADIQLGASIAGVSDRLVLAIQRVVGTTESFLGSLTWNEDV